MDFTSVIQMYEKRSWMTNMLNIDILLSTSSLYLADHDIHCALFLKTYRHKR